jgi:cell fate regulator YaaT (PSP1 superfamily)
MAKVQNLSLSPTKISGICGRLMCCLKFENDVYTDLRRNMPEVGEQVRTPDGLGKVVDTTVLEGKVKVRLYIDDPKNDSDEPGEKLSADIYTFTKDEIRRINKRFKKRQDDIFKGVDAEELKELEKIIQD